MAETLLANKIMTNIHVDNYRKHAVVVFMYTVVRKMDEFETYNACYIANITLQNIEKKEKVC